MKKDALKSKLYLFLLCIMAGNTHAIAPDVQRKIMKDYAKLIIQLGPQRAKNFKDRLEQKHTRKEPSKPVQPVKPPVTKPTSPVQPPVTIQPPMAPTVPPTKQWVLDTEKEAFHTIMNQLHNYITEVYKCLDTFFNRNNTDPYRTHVNCFKTQLKILQTQLQAYPQGQTPGGNAIFTPLKKIALILEKIQALSCQTMDDDYTSSATGGIALGLKLKGIKPTIDQQRNVLNEQIGVLRNELRKAHAMDMLQEVNKFNTTLNTLLDYDKNKTWPEMYQLINHRVKK